MQADVEAAARELQVKLSAILARLENAEADLAADYRWGVREVRSSDPPAEAAQIAELAGDNNVTGLLQIIDRKIARRPRDAGLLALRDYLESFDARATPSAMKVSAERCAGRAAFVPAGSIYDLYRAQILYLAADIANRSWAKELYGHAWGTASSPMAAYAVGLWDAVLEYYPNDEDGECRERRAWALMACGRLNEAVTQASEVIQLRKRTMRFATNYARLMNATGNTAKAFEWFSYAVKTLGFSAVALAKADPDLAAMRRAYAKAFDDLMAVKVTWNVEWGIFNDDITATNNSAFAITNVTLSCRIESGGKVWTPELKCDVIEPGQTYKWVNVISVPGSRMERGSATIACDQNN